MVAVSGRTKILKVNQRVSFVISHFKAPAKRFKGMDKRIIPGLAVARRKRSCDDRSM